MRRRRTVPAAVLLATTLLAGCEGSTTARGPSRSPSVTASPSPTRAASPTRSPQPWPPSGTVPAPLAVPPSGTTVIGVLGDYGVDDLPVRRVVQLMRGLDGGRALDAVVTTGDNAYQKGRAGEAAFARRMLEPLLGGDTRLIASLGNHDVATADGLNVMRSLGMTTHWYTAVVGPVEFVVLDSNHSANPAQLEFLERTLARRRTRFRVAVFHHPAASCSFHPPSKAVISNLLPRLRGRVDLILNGHNHTYERFRATPPSVTTGGGGGPLYPSARALCQGAAIVRYKTVYHAVRLVASEHTLVVEAVGTDQRVFDRLVLRR